MNVKGKGEERKVLEQKWLGKLTEEWLRGYSKPMIITNSKRNMALFCEWIGKTDTQLVEEFKRATDKEQWAKEMGDKLVEWLNYLLREGFKVNSARSYVSSPRAFFTRHCRPVKIGRKKFPKQQVATGEHEFSQNDLRKMFHYADTRGKAILSTAVSLGWAADDFLNLKRSEVEGLVSKALAEKQMFIGFTHVRGKTGATSRSHLTSEAVESLKAYLDITPKGAEYLWANGSLNDHLTGDTLNNILRDLVAKADIQTIGTVHFHLIRKFTMSTLSSAGIGDWDVKFMVGKEVPADIATYLINRKETLMEEFAKAYPKLSLTGYANRNHDKLSELEEKIAKLTEQNLLLWNTVEAQQDIIEERNKAKVKEKMAQIKELIKRSKAHRPT